MPRGGIDPVLIRSQPTWVWPTLARDSAGAPMWWQSASWIVPYSVVLTMMTARIGLRWRKHPEIRDLIFPSETGGPMNRKNLHRRHFRPLAEKAGLPKKARLYTLRHTFATLWMEFNEPVKILQEILGHHRIDQTMNTYAHVMPHIQADAFGRFSRRFSRR